VKNNHCFDCLFSLPAEFESAAVVVARMGAAGTGLLQRLAAAAPLSSSTMGSLLLKAILTNHHVFSDASKAAKNLEASLKLKADELELEKGRLEVELHK
jgi:hypothetical protein